MQKNQFVRDEKEGYRIRGGGKAVNIKNSEAGKEAARDIDNIYIIFNR